MIYPLAKVMGLKSLQKHPIYTTQENVTTMDYMHRKDTQPDRSDNINNNHSTYHFSQRKSIAHVLGKNVYFRLDY